MRLLCIDTTTVAGSTALTEDDRLIAQEQQGVAGTHSERLIASIEHLLGVARWELADVEGVVVAIGPGSFTGLRIGLAAAKGIAMTLRRPIAGVSSLASLALNGRGFAGTVVALIDARRGELYAAAWKVDVAGRMKAVLKEQVAPPEAVARELKKIRGELLLVGDGALCAYDRMRRAIGRRAALAQGAALWPQAANLASLALKRLRRERVDDLATLVPNYIRHSDAEIGFRGRAS
jgi:tRNA threonylcarbamoyladenosine biosynthesis protein TsaB